ncbi:MAG: hypothetical protein HQK55_08775, partial [Deltaproteobacteria bacterium]|nr:hypothetical protein [Deltaproteobacteria bacterium]
APLDLVAEKHNHSLLLLSPGQRIGAGRDLDPQHPVLEWVGPPENKEVERLTGEYLLPFHLLGDYLQHNKKGFENLNKSLLLRRDKVFCPEVRTGIARSEAFTAAESMLYTIRHYRLDDDPKNGGPCGLLASIEGDNGHLAKAGLLQLGGDFRAAEWTPVHNGQDGPWWKTNEDISRKDIEENGRFKAYFITPALFQKGCLPDMKGIVVVDTDDGKRVTLDIPTGNGSVKFILKGACIGPSRPVGGWDVQNQRPKPLRRAVPEGSVYFFEASDWGNISPQDRQAAAKAIMDRGHFKSWCSLESWPCRTEQGPGKEGFGIALIGGW